MKADDAGGEDVEVVTTLQKKQLGLEAHAVGAAASG